MAEPDLINELTPLQRADLGVLRGMFDVASALTTLTSVEKIPLLLEILRTIERVVKGAEETPPPPAG